MNSNRGEESCVTIVPVVPGQGSVGYIVHGAHIGLALLGIGEVV